MTRSMFNKLCCPVDQHDLEIQVVTEDEEGEILEALMSCPECGRYFPVIYGIPILIPDEYRDEEMEQPLLEQWGYQLEESPRRDELPERES